MSTRSDLLLLRRLASIIMDIPSRSMLDGDGIPGDRDQLLLMTIDAFRFDERVQELAKEHEAISGLSSKERNLVTSAPPRMWLDRAKEVRDERAN